MNMLSQRIRRNELYVSVCVHLYASVHMCVCVCVCVCSVLLTCALELVIKKLCSFILLCPVSSPLLSWLPLFSLLLFPGGQERGDQTEVRGKDIPYICKSEGGEPHALLRNRLCRRGVKENEAQAIFRPR